MAMLHKISVITPNYNNGKYLEQTIKSVLNQQYPNLEYIIIDGGSTDNSIEIIKKYEKHLAFWISEPDKGQSHAINKGFEKSTGDILCWLNSDDLFHDKTLFKVNVFFEKNPEKLFLWGNNSSLRNNIIQQSKPKQPASFYRLMYYLTIVNQESSFWRRSIYLDLGGLNETIDLAMDYDYWLKIFKSYSLKQIEYLEKETFGIVREGHLRKSSDWTAYLESMKDVRKKYLPFSNDFLNRIVTSFWYRYFRIIDKKNLYNAFQMTGKEYYLGLKGRLL